MWCLGLIADNRAKHLKLYDKDPQKTQLVKQQSKKMFITPMLIIAFLNLVTIYKFC